MQPGTTAYSSDVARKIEEFWKDQMLSVGMNPNTLEINPRDVEYWAYIMPYIKFVAFYNKKVNKKLLRNFEKAMGALHHYNTTSSDHIKYDKWCSLWIRIAPFYKWLTHNFLTSPITRADIKILMDDPQEYHRFVNIAESIKHSKPENMHNVSMIMREIHIDQSRLVKKVEKLNANVEVEEDVHVLDKRESWEMDINAD